MQLSLVPGPGAVVLLINPPRSDSTLANSATPILAPTRPLVAANGNFEFPDRQVVTEGTDTGGYAMNGAESRLNGIAYVPTNCSGETCDGQSMMSGGVVANRCACAQMKHHTGSVLIIFNVTIIRPDG